MTTFSLHEAKEPYRRIARVDCDVDPHNAEDAVALLRRLAPQYHRRTSDVILRWTGGKRVLEYRA
jgi:hypothetical protein